MESNLKDIVDKNDLNILDFFADDSIMNEKLVNVLSDIEIEPMFEDSRKGMNDLFKALKSNIEELDPTLKGAVDKARDRSLNNLDQLFGKAQKARERQHETTLRQVDKVRSIVYPNGNLQERELNFLYLAHKYGPDIIKWLSDQLAINKFEHQIIEL